MRKSYISGRRKRRRGRERAAEGLCIKCKSSLSCCGALPQYGERCVALYQKGRVFQLAQQHDRGLYAQIVDVYIYNGRSRFNQGGVGITVEGEEGDVVGNPQMLSCSALQRLRASRLFSHTMARGGSGRERSAMDCR